VESFTARAKVARPNQPFPSFFFGIKLFPSTPKNNISLPFPCGAGKTEKSTTAEIRDWATEKEIRKKEKAKAAKSWSFMVEQF
jgi:hypothetical protein